MSLARADQILMTRSVFDSTRQVLKGEDIEGLNELNELQGGSQLEWLNHGAYLLKGIEEPVEICEVREAGRDTGGPPATSEKAQRQARADEEQVLGWRPAVGQFVPNTRWQLEKKLGEGGFGEVWLGRNPTTKEQRVFKFCFYVERVRFLKRELTLFRLLKERIGDHPNIVRLHDVYLDQPPFYVEMDYVQGKDLKTWSEERGGVGSVPLEMRLEIVAQAADALQAAHEAGVIHRDIKPGNILIAAVRPVAAPVKARTNLASGTTFAVPNENQPAPSQAQLLVEVKLTDFGIGQVVSEEALAGITRAGFTQTIMSDSSSSHTGTQMYMAPELLAGKPASTRSDIYSLGVVLYQLLVGDFTRPVTTDWADDISDSLLRDDLRHCFAGNPNDRFAGAGQLAKSLRSLPERQSALKEWKRAERIAVRRRTVAVVGAGAASVLLLIVIALGFGLRRAEAEALKARQHLYAADMHMAFQALEANNLGRAVELLEKYRSQPKQLKLCGWEWRYLWQQCQSDELLALGSNSVAPRTIVFSADGKLLATSGGSLKLWDTVSRQKIATLVQDDAIGSMAFSPDGQTLAAGVVYQGVILSDMATRREVARFPARQEGKPVPLVWLASGLTFSPDNQTLAIGDFDGTINIWNLSNRSKITLTGHTNRIASLKFNSSGRILASASWDKTIKLWDTTTGRTMATLTNHMNWVHSLAWSPNDQILASGSWDRTVKLWDLARQPEVLTLTNHNAWVSSVAFSPDGKTLATASADQTIRLWDTATWRELRVLRGSMDEVHALAFSPKANILASGCKDGTIKLWDAHRKPREIDFKPFPLEFQQFYDNAPFALSADGGTVIVHGGGFDSLWDTVGLREISKFAAPGRANRTTATVAAAGALVAYGLKDGTVKLWDAIAGRETASLEGMGSEVGLLQFAFDGKTLAVASTNGTIKLWNVSTTNVIATFQSSGSYTKTMAFSRDGTFLAAVHLDGTRVKVWNVSERKQVAAWNAPRHWIRGVRFFPDGKTLATAATDARVKLWDVKTGREVATLGRTLTGFFCIAVSPDGQRLAAGTTREIKVWDMATQQEVGTLKGHNAAVYRLAFSADGNTLVSAGSDGVRVWRAPSWTEIEAAEQAKK